MGIALVDADEYTHEVGIAGNWNESRYIDFWDASSRAGGWLRMGNRPNERHAEMSACINLPDGRTGFMFARPEISANGLGCGGQSWEITSPWSLTRVRYRGDMILLDDAWKLIDPKRAFNESPRVPVNLELECTGFGLQSVLGVDQDHIDRIFLPGQADFHYQHLIRVTGTLKCDNQQWRIDGRGGKDHSWGPRNWHAKIYLRWLIASFNDDFGFMLTRAVGATKQTRSGFVWANGQLNLVDDFVMQNTYSGPHSELKRTEVRITSGSRVWQAVGTPQAWVPLRHRQLGADGKPALLRIVKSPTEWVSSLGEQGVGMTEYHDLMVDGRPVGIHD